MRGSQAIERFFENDRLSAWTSVKVRECHNEVEQEDDDRQSTAQQILQESTDFLRRFFVLVEGQGGVTLSYSCLHCHRYPLDGPPRSKSVSNTRGATRSL